MLRAYCRDAKLFNGHRGGWSALMRINIWIVLAILLALLPSLDTCTNGEIRSVSVSMTRPPRCAIDEKRDYRM
jgi:hypothetical protein